MYDYQAAIKAGAKPDDILNYLAQHNNYDVNAAIKAGADKMQVIDYLSKIVKPQATLAPEQVSNKGFLGTDKNDSLFGKLINNSVTRGIQTLFPGKRVGESIGTLAALTKANFKGEGDYIDTTSPTPLQVGGDIAAGALTIAAPNIGTGSGTTILGRILANTGFGTGLGLSNSLAEGNTDAKTIAKDTAISGLTAGGFSAGVEGLGALVKKLPIWFAKSALPKLSNGNVDYALANTKIGSIGSNIEKSNEAVGSFGSQIKSVLSHPQYVNEVGEVGSAIPTIEGFYSESGDSAEKIIKTIKQVAPGSKTIVDKVAEGTATLAEQNTLRQELDLATRKAYGDNPSLTYSKQIGKTMADYLRNNIQKTAPETASIFANFSKELNLNAALRAVDKKNSLQPTWIDFLAAYEGYQKGGAAGSLEAILLERGIKSPAGRLAAAKLFTNLNKVAPVTNAIGRGFRAPILNVMSTIGSSTNRQ